jgi:serine beta-lactamase-like protein LACTB, mitochondrial
VAQELEVSVNRMTGTGTVAGVSVSLAARTDVGSFEIIDKVSGMADLENRISLTPEHAIPIGSISKLITVATLARLVDQGKTQFEQPIAELVSEWQGGSSTVTLADLAGHLGGVRHVVYSDRFFGAWARREETHAIAYASVKDALKVFAPDDLVAAPRTRHHYSSYGYTFFATSNGAEPRR